MREILIVSIPLLLAIGCSTTAAEYAEMGVWSAAARKSCTIPGSCPEPRACIVAVVDATKPGAGRKEYQAAESTCWAYRGTP